MRVEYSDNGGPWSPIDVTEGSIVAVELGKAPTWSDDFGGRYRRSRYRYLRNAVRCLTCDTVIESTHRHDYRGCNCERVEGGDDTKVYVDGGHDYRKRSYGRHARFEEVYS